MSTACVFCKIVAGELPCHKVWESNSHLAFLSIFPNTDGVTVVIPKQHIPSYVFDMTDADMAALVVATKHVALGIDSALVDVGRCALVFEGFGVDHVHAKLFPMHGTADMAQWKPIESGKTEFFEKYPGYISSHDAQRADDARLAEIATAIRFELEK
jgi:diadenosine tetraphosphate (Ap4A) HIT family hydrolase